MLKPLNQQHQTSQSREPLSMYPQGSLNTYAERHRLILQVFEQYKKEGRQAPLLHELDEILDGRTLLNSPVVDSSNVLIKGHEVSRLNERLGKTWIT